MSTTICSLISIELFSKIYIKLSHTDVLSTKGKCLAHILTFNLQFNISERKASLSGYFCMYIMLCFRGDRDVTLVVFCFQ